MGNEQKERDYENEITTALTSRLSMRKGIAKIRRYKDIWGGPKPRKYTRTRQGEGGETQREKKVRHTFQRRVRAEPRRILAPTTEVHACLQRSVAALRHRLRTGHLHFEAFVRPGRGQGVS